MRIHDSRSWSSLHIFEGFVKLPEFSCARALVTDNEIGPAGFPGGAWADGISLACRDSLVAGNTITDATELPTRVTAGMAIVISMGCAE
jgi:hypothetical protein